jgi:hypothetical protein
MDQDQTKTSLQPLAFTLTVVAALLRLVPHPPNFAPVGSVALFGGAKLRGWQAYAVPILIMLLTDPLRSWMEGGFAPYSWGTPIIYGSILIYALLGRWLLRGNTSPVRIGSVAFLGSLQFFLVTNFFVWWNAVSLYPHTFAGLATCYTAALPFFGRTLLSDLIYSGVLFSAYALLKRRAGTTSAVHA